MNLAIYHNLPSGGGKRALFEMTRRLADRHKIDVYTLSTADHEFCDLRPHCRRHVILPFDPLPLATSPLGRFNQGIRSVDLLRLCALQRIIAAQIDAAHYDVVFVHNCQYGQSPSLLQYLRTPSVYYCQEPPRLVYEPSVDRPYRRLTKLQKMGNAFDPFPGLYRRTLKDLDRRNTRAASRVLVNSAYSRESLYRVYGLFAEVCYLGVDTLRFRPISVAKTDMVVSVGALVPSKGFDFLLQSLGQSKTQPRPGLVIVSNYVDAQELSYLEIMARKLSISTKFLHGISDERLVELYNQARLTLYAPIMEPFGFVSIESMACGTPVVAVREGGVRETITHGATGLLTERDPTEFAAAIDKLYVDSHLASEYGARGVRWVNEAWTWDTTLNRLVRHLEAVSQQG